MFTVRFANPSDIDFILAAFDSTLPFLQSLGNEGQWGTTPFSQQEGFIDEVHKEVARSENFHANSTGERFLALIAEREVSQNDAIDPAKQFIRTEQGKRYLSTGATYIRDDEAPAYFATKVPTVDAELKAAKEQGYIYMDVLLGYQDAPGPYRKGAGVALLDRVKQYAKDKNKASIYLEIWVNNENGLLR